MTTGAIGTSKMGLPITEKPHRHSPSPNSSSSSSAHPAFYITSWIFFSNLTILFNKWLIDSAGFRKSLTPPGLITNPFTTNEPPC